EQTARMVEVALAVLDAGDRFGIRIGKAFDDIRRNRNAADLRDMVEIDAKARIRDSVDHARVARIDAIIVYALDKERWQDQTAGAASSTSVCLVHDREGPGREVMAPLPEVAGA